ALNLLPLVYTELAPFGDQHFKVVATVRRGDDQAALALGFLAVGHGAGELGENRGILGLAGFEQVGNPRQTTGDIPGFGTLLGDPRNDVAGLDRLAVIEGDDGVRGQHVVCGHRGVGEYLLLALAVQQGDHGAHILARRRPLVGVHHRNVGQTGEVVGLALDAEALFHAGERHHTSHLGDNGVSVGVPLGHDLAGFDLVAVVDGDHRAVGNLVTLSFAAVEIGNRQLAGAGHRYLIVFPLHQLDVDEAHGTGGLDLDIVHRGSPRRRATDVEGAHGELGAGLADGLGGDNTHRLPLVDLVAPG